MSLRPNGGGAFGNGGYDILGPTGDCFGYPTIAAGPGDGLALFAVGFGPTNPAVPSGQAYSGAAPLIGPISLSVNNVALQPLFVGLSSAGRYQINIEIPPGLGQGDVPIQALVDGLTTQKGVYLSLLGSVASPSLCSIGNGGTGDGGGGDGSGGGGDGGGVGGGGGDGG